MSIHRGLIRGFIAGVVVTLLGAGLSGYLLYQRIQSRISPEGVRQKAERALGELTGKKVEVGSAQVTFPNLLTLERVRLSSATETILVMEKLEAFAEGGLEGLQESRFAQLVVTNPVLSLERRDGKWNLVEFLAPLAQLAARAPVAGTSSGHGLPLTLVRVRGLNVTVALENRSPYSGIELADFILSRDKGEGPWSLRGTGGKIRLNPDEAAWPLPDLAEEIRDLFAGTQAPKTQVVDPSQAAPETTDQWLADVALEDVSLELVHSHQSLSLGGISFSAADLFRTLRLQTGSLEKKNLNPGS